QGADFAVWIDELHQSLGNPLLVEVKAGDVTASRLDDAAEQLRYYIGRTHGRSGLLVYWGRQNREYPALDPRWPLVIRLSFPRLSKLVAQDRLVEELIRLRNAAVHGKG
ncbi:MAG: hypothetical protein ACE5JL_09955, partial [Dehalococcoidia bacterium]